jgi:gliding motility-associated-like protein
MPVKKLQLIKALLILLFSVFGFSQSFASTKFIPNKGQWPSNVLYRADIPSGAFFLEKDQITYYFYDQAALHELWHNFKKDAVIQNLVIRVKFTGSPGASSIVSSGTESSEYYNYFIGNDPSKWASKIFANDEITMHDVWPGIDLLIKSSGDGIKYTFKVMPHADPSQIKLQYLGTDGLSVDENDTLRINNLLTSIIEQPPVAYQFKRGLFKKSSEYKDVPVHYNLTDGTMIGFNLGSYAHRDTLTIDPIVVFATFSGSKADNFGFTGTFNLHGNGFSGGTVYSAGFPTTTGAFQITYQGGQTTFDNFSGWMLEYGRDAGILKYSPDGTKLLWATYLGGSRNEQPHSMVVNSKDELVIFGTTTSSNFPVTSGAYDTKYHANWDLFICKLSSDGTKMIASTYVGGNGADGFNGDQPYNEPTGPLAYNYGDAYRGEVIVDKSDNVLVATCTQSSDLAPKNAFQSQFGGVQDGLVLKMSSDLSNLIWMSFLGGRDQDAAYGIHLDSKENIFVCGGTMSADFPRVFPPLRVGSMGYVDGFLTKISPDGKSILASTFLGNTAGSLYGQNYLVQTDANDKVYVTGQTLGSFPVTGNCYHNTNGKNYIAEVDNNLTTILYSTVLGSGGTKINLSPTAFLVDLCGRVYLSGWGGWANTTYNTNSNRYKYTPPGNTYGLATTPDAYQSRTNGSNFYLIILSKNMQNLVYATYFGGLGSQSEEHVDGGTSRFDRNGIVYQSVCGGCGGYSDFPTTPNAWSRTNNGVRAFDKNEGGCNNALFKIDLNSADFPPRFKDTLLVKQIGQDIDYSFDITDPQGDSVYVYATGTVLDKKLVNPAAIFTADLGIGTVKAHFHWTTDCNHYLSDTVVVAVTARNNSCPVPRTITHYIRIVLMKPPVPPVPDMFCIEHIDDHTVRVRWTGVNMAENLKEIRLVKIYPNGQEVILKTSNGLNPDSYIDPAAPNNIDTNYRYFLYSVSACGEESDTGRIAGTVPEKDSIPYNMNIFSVSVEKNKNIRVLWNQYNNNNFYDYFLYRKINDGKSQYRLYKIIKTQVDTSFLDSDVNVQTTSYCYKLFAQNQCGLISKNGNYGCSIVLRGKSIPFEHQLTWNMYELWKNGVNHYDVFRRDPSRKDSLIGFTTAANTYYKDDSLDYDQGLYWYHVVAKADSGNAMSISNEIQLIQAPILYVPNAFTPNADDRNDKWRTVPVFVKDYYMHVYNRWGEYIWHADKKHLYWDGTYKGAPASNDCFIWQVEYTGWDGSTHYRHGFVTTLP